MKAFNRSLAIYALALLMVAASSEADSYRCGSKLIRTGDTKADVLRVCGEPMAKERGRADVRIDGGARNVSVERWHYRRSQRSLGHIVNIYRGRVVSIDVSGR